MRLQLELCRLSRVFVVALILVASVGGAAGLGVPHNRPCRHLDGRDSGQIFPLLRWLRDSLVEIVFGEQGAGGAEKGRVGSPRRHDGAGWSQHGDDVVIRFNVTNSQEGALSEAADRLLLDVWEFTQEYVDVRLRKDDVASLMTLLPSTMQPSVLIPDVAFAARATYPSWRKRSGPEWAVDTQVARAKADGLDDVFFQDFQPLSVIASWLRLLEAMFPSYVGLVSLGESYEGRDITAVRLGARANGNTEPRGRKTILITGGFHGREWISTSTVTYLIWSFATQYGEKPLVTKLLQNFDFVFIPIANPDGYEYTWEHDRLWRKTRQQTNMRFCRGVDLNHAFGYKWEAYEHQWDPCSESYGGDKPFQAVEATRIAEWAKNETDGGTEFVGYLDLHSYSQQILFPYSYDCSADPPNRENLEELGVGLAKAVRLSSGELYTVKSACEGAVSESYSASGPVPRVEAGGGSAIDWFYHDLKARFSYQIKLRDTGAYGFLLPPENIVPAGEEAMNAVKYFGDFLLGNNGIEHLVAETEDGAATEGEWRDLRKRRRA